MGYTKQGELPFVTGSDTSERAAESMEETAGTVRSAVLACIVVSGPGGMTCDEVEAVLGGRHQTISARVRELVQRGSILDTKRRRLTRSGRGARVYVAVEYLLSVSS